MLQLPTFYFNSYLWTFPFPVPTLFSSLLASTSFSKLSYGGRVKKGCLHQQPEKGLWCGASNRERERGRVLDSFLKASYDIVNGTEVGVRSPHHCLNYQREWESEEEERWWRWLRPPLLSLSWSNVTPFPYVIFVNFTKIILLLKLSFNLCLLTMILKIILFLL